MYPQQHYLHTGVVRIVVVVWSWLLIGIFDTTLIQQHTVDDPQKSWGGAVSGVQTTTIFATVVSGIVSLLPGTCLDGSRWSPVVLETCFFVNDGKGTLAASRKRRLKRREEGQWGEKGGRRIDNDVIGRLLTYGRVTWNIFFRLFLDLSSANDQTHFSFARIIQYNLSFHTSDHNLIVFGLLQLFLLYLPSTKSIHLFRRLAILTLQAR